MFVTECSFADAKFWVGRGEQPSPQGIRIPDENGKEAPLRRYDRKTIVLTLPGVSDTYVNCSCKMCS